MSKKSKNDRCPECGEERDDAGQIGHSNWCPSLKQLPDCDTCHGVGAIALWVGTPLKGKDIEIICPTCKGEGIRE